MYILRTIINNGYGKKLHSQYNLPDISVIMSKNY